jgi:hypothetical protein
MLSQSRFDQKLTIKVVDLPLLVFGEKDPAIGVVLEDAFNRAFSIAANKKCG